MSIHMETYPQFPVLWHIAAIPPREYVGQKEIPVTPGRYQETVYMSYFYPYKFYKG